MYYGEGLGASAGDAGRVIGGLVGLPKAIAGQFREGYETTSGQRLPSKLPPVIGQAASLVESLFGHKSPAPSPILPTVGEQPRRDPGLADYAAAVAPYALVGVLAWKLLKGRRR